MRLASCKSALGPPVAYSADCSKAVVPVLVLLFVALWFILRGDLFYVLPCVILFLCFSVLLALRLPRLGGGGGVGGWGAGGLRVVERGAGLGVFRTFVRLRLFGFDCFLFLLVSGMGCGFGLRFVIVAHSLDFSLTFFG